MRLQTKLTLTILPLTALAIFAMGLWSVQIIGRTLEENIDTLMEQEIEDFVHHTIHHYHEILQENQLDTVQSYVKSYQRKAYEKASSFHLLEGGNLLIMDSSGLLIHQHHESRAVNAVNFSPTARKIAQIKNSRTFNHIETGTQHFIYTGKYFEPWNWVILYVLPHTAVHQAQSKVKKTFSVVGLLFVVGASAFTTITLRYFFVKPVTHLQETAKRIAELKEIPSVRVNTNDELGELAQSMGSIAASITEYRKTQENWQHHLESEIDKRTRDLFDTNTVLTREIESRKQVEIDLRHSEERFQAIFESTTDCILVWDENYNSLYANQAAIDHVGTSRERVIGKNIKDGLGHVPEFMKLWMDRIDRCFLTGEPFTVEDAAPVGEITVHSESVLSPIKDSEGNMFAVGVVYRDVTERRLMEERITEALELNRKIISSSSLGITAYADNGQCMLTNDAAADIIGAAKKMILSQNFNHVGSWLKTGLTETANKVLEDGKQRQFELHSTTSFGKDVWLDIRLSQFKMLGKPHLLLIFDNIIERKQLEKQLNASLVEKDILLKEIHHRVKNNLQVVSSMLKMQARQTEDTFVQEVFAESQSRITSMALVHEQLYKSDNLATINFANYLKDLVQSLQYSLEAATPRISIILKIKDPKLSLDAAIPCGLIVTELLTNAFKYAFIPGKKGNITISFENEKDKRAVLVLKDDGIGIAPDFDITQTQTLGLRLVYNLVTHQLEGDIRVVSCEGTLIEISFPYHIGNETARITIGST